MLSSLIFTSLILGNLILSKVEAPKVEPMEILLDRLAICESSGRKNAINIMDGDASSFGLFQFKIKSFVHFGRRYGLEHSDIWSSEQQRAIAKALIEDGRGQQHFKNCWRKLNLL